MPQVTLSPPWYIFANEIKYTYGLSPHVKVNALVETGSTYTLTINVSYDDIANALRQILPLSKDFGGVVVDIIVFNSKGIVVPVSNTAYTPKSLAATLCTALDCNPLFYGCVLTAGKVPPLVQGTVGDVVAIIKKSVVQFYDDDISDLCSNFNEVAANVFSDVSNLAYAPNLKISFSTHDAKCPLQKNLYC